MLQQRHRIRLFSVGVLESRHCGGFDSMSPRFIAVWEALFISTASRFQNFQLSKMFQKGIS